MSTLTLPEYPSLNNLKNQAKHLLKQHRSGDTSVCNIVRCLHKYKNESDDVIFSQTLHLHDMQFALAVAYGFSSWNDLRNNVVAITNDRPQHSLLNESSLLMTVNAVNQAYFDNKDIPKNEKLDIARWIAGRRGQKNSYSGLYAPTDIDFNLPRLFTGEPLTTGASVCHVIGEEAACILNTLNVNDHDINKSLELTSAIVAGFNHYGQEGYFCCAKCSVAMWRHVSVSQMPKREEKLAAGMQILNENRDGNYGWKRFPFYYTLYTLSAMNIPEAVEEIKYVLPKCERLIRRTPGDDPYLQRRFILMNRLLDSYA